MAVQSALKLYTHKARLYQRFFIDFLQWEKVLGAYFQSESFLHSRMRILDAGCGTGPITRSLYSLARKRGFEGITFHAFDLTPAMLEIFRQWIETEDAQNMHTVQADVLDLESQLPHDWAGYDWIITSGMLEYIPNADLELALGNLRGLLNPDGHLLLFATRRNWITRWVGTSWWGANLFDQEKITLGLKSVGFKAIRFKDLPGYWRSFMMAVEASK